MFRVANINSSAIVAAASLVARTLYILASNNKDLSNSSINSIKVNTSLVDELLVCLLNCEPGLSCELVNHYISPFSTCPSHYVGVIQGEPSSEPYLGHVGDVSRFVWNYMADKTSIPSKNVSPCSENCSKTGGICIKQEIDGKGECVMSTTRYLTCSNASRLEVASWESRVSHRLAWFTILAFDGLPNMPNLPHVFSNLVTKLIVAIY